MKKILREGEWLIYLFTGCLIIAWIPLLTGVILEQVVEISTVASLTWEKWVIASLFFIGTILVSLYWGIHIILKAPSKSERSTANELKQKREAR